jgi:hypothetical protein
MFNELSHAEDCLGGPGECEPVEGQWMQPPGTYRGAAEAELGDDAPMCRIFERANELMAEEE